MLVNRVQGILFKFILFIPVLFSVKILQGKFLTEQSQFQGLGLQDRPAR